MRTIFFNLKTLFIILILNCVIFGQVTPYSVINNFVASGYMGDMVTVTRNYKVSDRQDSLCTKVTYYRVGKDEFAGLYWQHPANNWCSQNGRDLSSYGFTRVTFWVKGGNGGEEIKFKVGQDCGDSFVSDEITQILTRQWTQVIINVNGNELTNISGAFCFVIDSKANVIPLTFYIDDVRFE